LYLKKKSLRKIKEQKKETGDKIAAIARLLFLTAITVTLNKVH